MGKPHTPLSSVNTNFYNKHFCVCWADGNSMTCASPVTSTLFDATSDHKIVAVVELARLDMHMTSTCTCPDMYSKNKMGTPGVVASNKKHITI